MLQVMHWAQRTAHRENLHFCSALFAYSFSVNQCHILGLFKTDVFSMWVRLPDEHRQLAWRNRGGSQYQLSSPRQHFTPEVVLSQHITVGSATPQAAHPSSPAEEIPWAQVCNSVLELRTDFLIPFFAEEGKI